MADAQAFVAEIAVDLEDLLEAAHDEPLEVEFGRHAEVEVHVEGVVMGGEGPGRGAAGDGLHHGRLDLQVALVLHEAPHGADDARPGLESLQHLAVGNEVQVPLAVALLLVLEAVPLLGQGQQGLAEELDLLHPDAQFAGLGAHEGAGDTHEVAHIDELEDLPAGLGQVVHPEEGLQFLAVFREVREHALAHLADGEDAAHDRHGEAQSLQGLVGPGLGIRIGLGQLGDAVGALRLTGPDLQPKGLELLELLEAHVTVLIGLHGDSGTNLQVYRFFSGPLGDRPRRRWRPGR